MTTTTHVIPKSRVVYIERTVHIIECSACSVDFGIGDDFMKRRREDHGTFYCPNGHANVYRGDNEAERLRKELERTKARAESNAAYAERERGKRLLAERQRAAAKGQVTRIKNRVSKGLCPCCNRTFQNLAAHMAGQHPDYTGDPT